MIYPAAALRRLYVDSGLIAHDEMKNLAGSLSSINYSRTFRRNNLRYKLNNNVNLRDVLLFQ